MFNRLRITIMIVLALLCSAVALAPRASADTGTIETKSGERLENVNYSIDDNFKIIKVQVANTSRNISFLDIKSVYDPSGKDVTASVLGTYYRQPGETWQSDSAPVHVEGRKKLWDFALRLAGNFSIPTGNYYEGITSGVGFEGDVIIPVSRELSIRGSMSRSGLKNGGDIVPLEVGFHATRYLGSIQYNAPFRSVTPQVGLWYVYTGLGAINHTLSYQGVSVSESKFLTEFGAGGVSFVSPGLGIDYSGSIGLVWIGRDEYYGSTQSGVLFDLKFGLSYWFAHR